MDIEELFNEANISIKDSIIEDIDNTGIKDIKMSFGIDIFFDINKYQFSIEEIIILIKRSKRSLEIIDHLKSFSEMYNEDHSNNKLSYQHKIAIKMLLHDIINNKEWEDDDFNNYNQIINEKRNWKDYL